MRSGVLELAYKLGDKIKSGAGQSAGILSTPLPLFLSNFCKISTKVGVAVPPCPPVSNTPAHLRFVESLVLAVPLQFFCNFHRPLEETRDDENS